MPALRPVLPQQTLPPLALPQLTHPWDSTSWLPRPSEPRRREVKVQSAVAFKDIYRGPLIFIFLLKISGNLSCVLYIFLLLLLFFSVFHNFFLFLSLSLSFLLTYPPTHIPTHSDTHTHTHSQYVCTVTLVRFYT